MCIDELDVLAFHSEITLIRTPDCPDDHRLQEQVPMAPKVYFFRGGSDLLFLEAELLILEVV